MTGVSSAVLTALTALPEAPGATAATGAEVDWLHVDESFVVVNKPSGLPSVPRRATHLHDCMAARVQAHCPDALVVHRLDMATSGLMLLARGVHAQRLLSTAFADRLVDKRYVAWVHGLVAHTAGEIALPLLADWPNRPRQRVDPEHGKPSLTRYTVIARDAQNGRTRLELQPVTGRSHQLRVHLQALGHPILGDMLYAPAEVQVLATRLLLHAESLAFDHPVSGERLHFQAATPF